MAKKKASDWAKHDELLAAGSKGWNVLTRLPEVLKKEFPDLNEFEFGFISEEDVPAARSQYWDYLEEDDFDTDEFSKTVGIGFGIISDAAGHVKYKHNYIMVQPKDFRMRLRKRRYEEAEKLYKAQVDGEAYIAPGDDGGSCESEFEEGSVTVPIQEKRKPGRPAKK